MKVDICIPVYNEARILELNIRKLLEYCLRAGFSFDWKVVLVLNGSTDESLSIAKRIRAELPGLLCVVEAKEKGRGAALKEYWLSSEADILAYMDADLAVSLGAIDKLIRAIGDESFDLAIGSRLLPDSKIDRSFWRELVSQSYIYVSRLVLGHRFSDLQCGFKAIKRKAFLSIADNLSSKGWFFDTELIFFSQKRGFRVREIAVEWEENRYDQRQSKVKVFRDSLRFLKDMAGLRLRTLGSKDFNISEKRPK
jgi:glycosyltransferase involved in cell wall biosynthesis